MSQSVSLDSIDQSAVFIDVRKPIARSSSGSTIPQSTWHHPFDAVRWAERYAGCKVVVFCVHGHEVSQAVAGFLRDEGADAVFLEGGFEAWCAAGRPMSRIDD